jgi:hypothetical protein
MLTKGKNQMEIITIPTLVWPNGKNLEEDV